MDLRELRQQLMSDPEVTAAYEKRRVKIELGRTILDLRLARGWSQKELAERAGTKQAIISRLENGHLNPSLEMVQRVAKSLDMDLTVGLVPRRDAANATGTNEVIAERADLEQAVSAFEVSCVWYDSDAKEGVGMEDTGDAMPMPAWTKLPPIPVQDRGTDRFGQEG